MEKRKYLTSEENTSIFVLAKQNVSLKAISLQSRWIMTALKMCLIKGYSYKNANFFKKIENRQEELQELLCEGIVVEHLQPGSFGIIFVHLSPLEEYRWI